MESTEKYNPSDASLWAQFKEGDAEAFRLMYERYNNILFKYGLSVINDREIVKDAMQDLFVELWKKRGNLSIANSVKFYLLISLRRLLIQKSKDEQKRNGNLKLFNWQIFEDKSPAIIEKMIHAENQHAQALVLNEGLKSLPSRQREVIFLRFYQDLDYKDVGIIMNLSYQVVRNTIHKAVKSLRKNIGTSGYK
jgi:RNA polymerase sigma factor (sigma-70 family)